MNENIVKKPWGYYEDIHRSKELVFKRIVVNPECRLSLQSHKLRSEIWYIERGFAKIIVGDDIHKCGANCSVNIPLGYVHRMENLSKDHELVIFEVQIGECDEDDIVRLEDDYCREENLK